MKFPSSVQVGLFEYTILIGDPTHANGLYGKTTHSDLQIVIYPTGKDTVDLDTLWHEIKHAIWHMINLQDTDDEERIIRAMTTAELKVYQDNPELLELFCDTLFTSYDDAD